MESKRPVMAANWKMNLSLDEARDLILSIKQDVPNFPDVEVILAPPFTTLHLAKELVSGTGILIAGQNMHWETRGAYTGEISPAMLKEAGCSHVILGHSERRQLFYETNEVINKKIRRALEHGLKPIICIGETLKQRKGKKTFDVLEKQLNESIVPSVQESAPPSDLILAYEPVWAIGTGKTASPEQAQEVHQFIRNWIKEFFGPPLAESLIILYGGSVKPENIKSIMAQPDINGALIGGASLKAHSFLSMISACSK